MKHSVASERENGETVNVIKQLLFPLRCPVCDDIVTPFGEKICPKCRSTLEYVKVPRCYICGKELKQEEQEYCYDCSRKKHEYLAGRAVYNYKSVSDSLYRFKYGGRREYAGFYGEEMERVLGSTIYRWNPQALIPVPIHFTRWQKRGYNQATLLARELGRRCNIPVKTNLIYRIKKTIPLKELDVTERQNNLKKAFIIGRNDVKLERVVVVDDIYTTGSTIDAIAAELKKVGIQEIYFVSLAIGKGR